MRRAESPNRGLSHFSRRRKQSSLAGGLKQLDRIAGWILKQDLPATGTIDNVVAKTSARFTQRVDRTGEVRRVKNDPIPAARLGMAAVGHRLRGPASAFRRAQYELQVVARQYGKTGSGLLIEAEVELSRIELHGYIDIIDHVAHARRRWFGTRCT